MGDFTTPGDSEAQGFELRHHHRDDLSGFSASVFFDRSQGKYVLAIRGTAGLVDIMEDVSRIGLQGFAGAQAVSLYRYYKRLTTAPGERVTYTNSEIARLNSLQLGLPINISIVADLFTRSAFTAALATDVGVSPLNGSAASVLPQGTPVVVTGHSLGGHLALLFGRLFPNATEHVYTYNAPGISLIGEAALRGLGISAIDPTRVTNIASVMGSEPISRIWSKPVDNTGIFTEAGSPLYQHSIVPLTDSLALYGAVATLSPGLAGDATAVSGIISAASSNSEQSLEAVLDALRVTLGDDGEPTSIARTLADVTERDSYYQNLYAMLDARVAGRDYQIESLVGKSAGEIATMAAEDVSVRFALNELLPFAAKSADFSSFDDDFSGQWLASRAEWLEAMLDGNLVDRVFGFSGTSDNVLYRDVDAELRYAKLDGIQGNLAVPISALADRSRIQQFLDSVAYSRSVVFGSESADEGDQILGLSGGDRFFGADGDDRLDGAGGDDYLEGGAGADTLIGGAGDDTLNGGAGTDRLEGGAGSDMYQFSGTLDADTIVDRDGWIYAGSDLLTGGSGARGGPYLSSDGRFTYAFDGDLSGPGTLLVNGALRVEGFRDGDLGIRLGAITAPGGIEEPATDTAFLGDYRYEPVGDPVTNEVMFDRDQYGNPLPQTRREAVPNRAEVEADFPGTPGNDHYILGGGNDRVADFDGYGGDDWIELGAGDDSGLGGDGNDLLEGGPGIDGLAGGAGDDILIAGTTATLDADLDDSASGGLPADGLSGDDGDDVLYGNAGANLLDGGAGSDRIYGGAGNDQIQADKYSPLFPLDANSVPDPVAADEIDAGAGDDFVLARGGDDLIFAGAGNDTVFSAGEGSAMIFGGDGNDTIFLFAYDNDGFDFVDGGPGDDSINSQVGSSVLVGGAGNDIIASTGDGCTLVGGEGDDLLAVQDAGGVLDGGPGNDFLLAQNRADGESTFRWGRGYGSDVGIFSFGAVVVEAFDVLSSEISLSRLDLNLGGADNPGIEFRIRGSPDALFVPFAPEFVQSTAFRIEFADGVAWDWERLDALLAPVEAPEPSSEIPGTASGELLYGSPGPDGITGGAGDDWLIGDAGNDIYRYGQGDGFDVIDDRSGTDALEFATGISPADLGIFSQGDDYVLTAGPGGVRLRGGRAPEGAIERVEFSDATVWSAAELEGRAQVLPDNRAPQMPALLGSVAVDPGSPVAITIPADTISDPDRFDSLSYFAVTADGDPLPGWLAFDAASLTFSGTPAASDSGSHEVVLIAADANGAASIGSLSIEVGAAEAAPEPEIPAAEPVETTAADTGTDVSATDVGVSEPAPEPEVPATEVVETTAAGTGTDAGATDAGATDAGAREAAPEPGIPAAKPGELTAGIGSDTPPPPNASALARTAARREDAFAESAPGLPPAREPPKVGVPADPVFRDMQQRMDILLQTGRTNLGERYAEAIREFEERRARREEAPPPPPPSEDEIAAWNSAMHAWHDRNPGFAESDLGGNDGAWTMGWGLPGPEDRVRDGSVSAGSAVGLGNPGALARLRAADSNPALVEGLRDLR